MNDLTLAPNGCGKEKAAARNQKVKSRIKRVAKTGVTDVNLESSIRGISILENAYTDDSNPENVKNDFDCNNSNVTGVTHVTASNGEGCSGNTDKKAGVTGVTDLINNAIDPNEDPPPKIEAIEVDRPGYGVYDDFNEFGKAGVYYHGIKTDKEGNVTDTNSYICDPLHIDAGSCDSSDHNFGLMLRFKN